MIQTDVSGRVEVEPSSSAWPRSPSKSSASSLASNGSAKNSESEDSNATPGKILYELNGNSLILFKIVESKIVLKLIKQTAFEYALLKIIS